MKLSFATMQKYSLAVAGGVLFLFDRVLKFVSLEGQLSYFKNDGLVFSLPTSQNMSLFINIFILIIVVWIWLKTKQPAFGLIILGGLSNLIDRLIYGGVIDYIFIIPNAPFNISDVMILSGIILFLLQRKKDVIH